MEGEKARKGRKNCINMNENGRNVCRLRVGYEVIKLGTEEWGQPMRFRGSVLVLRPKDKCRRMVWSWRNWNRVMPKVHRVRLLLGIIWISPSPPSLFPMATPAFRLLFLMGTNSLPRNLTFLGLPALTMNAGPINFPTSFRFWYCFCLVSLFWGPTKYNPLLFLHHNLPNSSSSQNGHFS